MNKYLLRSVGWTLTLLSYGNALEASTGRIEAPQEHAPGASKQKLLDNLDKLGEKRREYLVEADFENQGWLGGADLLAKSALIQDQLRGAPGKLGQGPWSLKDSVVLVERPLRIMDMLVRQISGSLEVRLRACPESEQLKERWHRLTEGLQEQLHQGIEAIIKIEELAIRRTLKLPLGDLENKSQALKAKVIRVCRSAPEGLNLIQKIAEKGTWGYGTLREKCSQDRRNAPELCLTKSNLSIRVQRLQAALREMKAKFQDWQDQLALPEPQTVIGALDPAVFPQAHVQLLDLSQSLFDELCLREQAARDKNLWPENKLSFGGQFGRQCKARVELAQEAFIQAFRCLLVAKTGIGQDQVGPAMEECQLRVTELEDAFEHFPKRLNCLPDIPTAAMQADREKLLEPVALWEERGISMEELARRANFLSDQFTKLAPTAKGTYFPKMRQETNFLEAVTRIEVPFKLLKALQNQAFGILEGVGAGRPPSEDVKRRALSWLKSGMADIQATIDLVEFWVLDVAAKSFGVPSRYGTTEVSNMWDGLTVAKKQSSQLAALFEQLVGTDERTREPQINLGKQVRERSPRPAEPHPAPHSESVAANYDLQAIRVKSQQMVQPLIGVEPAKLTPIKALEFGKEGVIGIRTFLRHSPNISDEDYVSNVDWHELVELLQKPLLKAKIFLMKPMEFWIESMFLVDPEPYIGKLIQDGLALFQSASNKVDRWIDLRINQLGKPWLPPSSEHLAEQISLLGELGDLAQKMQNLVGAFRDPSATNPRPELMRQWRRQVQRGTEFPIGSQPPELRIEKGVSILEQLEKLTTPIRIDGALRKGKDPLGQWTWVVENLEIPIRNLLSCLGEEPGGDRKGSLEGTRAAPAELLSLYRTQAHAVLASVQDWVRVLMKRSITVSHLLLPPGETRLEEEPSEVKATQSKLKAVRDLVPGGQILLNNGRVWMTRPADPALPSDSSALEQLPSHPGEPQWRRDWKRMMSEGLAEAKRIVDQEGRYALGVKTFTEIGKLFPASPTTQGFAIDLANATHWRSLVKKLELPVRHVLIFLGGEIGDPRQGTMEGSNESTAQLLRFVRDQCKLVLREVEVWIPELRSRGWIEDGPEEVDLWYRYYRCWDLLNQIYPRLDFLLRNTAEWMRERAPGGEGDQHKRKGRRGPIGGPPPSPPTSSREPSGPAHEPITAPGAATASPSKPSARKVSFAPLHPRESRWSNDPPPGSLNFFSVGWGSVYSTHIKTAARVTAEQDMRLPDRPHARELRDAADNLISDVRSYLGLAGDNLRASDLVAWGWEDFLSGVVVPLQNILKLARLLQDSPYLPLVPSGTDAPPAYDTNWWLDEIDDIQYLRKIAERISSSLILGAGAVDEVFQGFFTDLLEGLRSQVRLMEQWKEILAHNINSGGREDDQGNSDS
ncbi:MAG: hypothetical protein LBI20_02545 [Holosporales bacterium]|jgi:hypothetical protein|nr:hypothetical protein [Holosporales bacterium]